MNERADGKCVMSEQISRFRGSVGDKAVKFGRGEF